MEKVLDQLENLKIRLENSTRFDEVIAISREIYFLNLNKTFGRTQNLPLAGYEKFDPLSLEIWAALKNKLLKTKNLAYQKIIIKVITQISKLAEFYARSYSIFEEEYKEKFSCIGFQCIQIYGYIQNQNLFDEFIYNKDIIITNFIVLAKEKPDDPCIDSKYFPLSIENFIQALDIQLLDPFDVVHVFTVILTSLENNRLNVHKLLLELFSKIILIASDEEISTMIYCIYNELSWYNRKKYYLLCNVISVKPEMLLNYNEFDLEQFINGIRIGLSQYHLYSSSLALIKVINNKDPYRKPLKNLVLKILLNGSLYEVKNLIKFWFSSFDHQFLNELFDNLLLEYDFRKVTSTSRQFSRAVIIRNAFNRNLSIEMENSIETFCCMVSDVNLKIEIFNILLNKIYGSQDQIKSYEQTITRLLKFLQYNMNFEDSAFIDNVMKKLPQFFNFLATSRFRRVDVCEGIFRIIKNDIYFYGIEFGSYESRAFSIRMIEIILKQYSGCMRGNRLSKHTDNKSNLLFKEYLKVNKIWDITSEEIYQHLLKSAEDTENSDLSSIAIVIIVEYFVKTLIVDNLYDNFIDWISVKVQETLNFNDVENYHENISYCIMIFEYLNVKNKEIISQEITKLMIELKSRSKELRKSADPVNEMENGKNLFVIVDCINYAISKIDNSLDDLKMFGTILKLITYQFLEFINDGNLPSFDSLDKNLEKYVVNSVYKTENVSDMKHKLLLSIFFTLRAISKISVTLTKIINSTIKPSENEYSTIIKTCIELNIQILTRFCHKGAIESASQSLGIITKIISTEFSQQCDRNCRESISLQKLLITLKNEIDCGKRHESKTGEIRGSRGFLIMSHQIIKNHPPFLKFLMERLLLKGETVAKICGVVNGEIQSEKQSLPGSICFKNDVQPIHLHLLAALIKDSELVEEMMRYYDLILVSTFRAYKESIDFIKQNALLQILGCITPKISNHKRHSIDDKEMPDYESKAISSYEFYIKMNHSFKTACADLYDYENFSQTYIIILLEVFSNFEHRRPILRNMEIDCDFGMMSANFQRLFHHPCEKIRILAAKCYAQWCMPEILPKILDDKLQQIFLKDPNLAHACIISVRHMIQRYEACMKFIKPFDRNEFLNRIREKIVEIYNDKESVIPKNFYLRCYLLDFLMFIGFKFDHDVVQQLMNETNIESNIGYSLWCKKVVEYRDNQN